MARPVTAGRLVARLAAVVGLFALVLLVPAGTWQWPAAWLFLGLYLAFAIPVGVWLFRTNPDLLARRLDWGQRAPKGWDRVLMAALIPAFVAAYAVAGLDFRFGWSDLPPPLRAVAFVLASTRATAWPTTRSRCAAAATAGSGETKPVTTLPASAA